MKKAYSFLFVCLGNICRSPVAEGIMRDKASKANLNIKTDSAGTNNYHTNDPPDKRSIANAKTNGVDISDLRARTFRLTDFDLFDVIYVMDESNYKNITSFALTDVHKQKVKLILNVLSNAEYTSVPDPYYGTEKDFNLVYSLLDSACNVIIENIKRND